MYKDTAIAVVVTASVVAALGSSLHLRKIKKLVNVHDNYATKIGTEGWRIGFLDGFEDCNRRLNYTIPREEYPTFED